MAEVFEYRRVAERKIEGFIRSLLPLKEGSQIKRGCDIYIAPLEEGFYRQIRIYNLQDPSQVIIGKIAFSECNLLYKDKEFRKGLEVDFRF